MLCELHFEIEIIPKEKISNLHYTRCITPKRVTCGGAPICDLTPAQYSSEETAGQLRAVGDIMPV